MDILSTHRNIDPWTQSLTILYVTSTKLKKVSDRFVKPVSHLILKVSFLTLFGYVVKITLDINPIYG